MNQINKRLNLITFALFTLMSINVHASLDFKIKNIDGSEHTLSEYIGKGKWVVLNIWGTRCPPCREEMPELVRFHDEHKDTDGIVIGIAIDFPSYGYAKKQEVIDFADDYLIDFPLFLSDSTITEKIGVGKLEALPSTYVFNPDGEIVGMQIGGITQKIIEDFINRKKLKPSGGLKQQPN